jgi:predicted nucleic acid-binding protein
MIVVSDTSCISNLLSIGREELLPRLFGEVLIPPERTRAGVEPSDDAT